MAREDPTIYMRLPAELKHKLEVEADIRKRSLTAEVVSRLQDSLLHQDAALLNYKIADARDRLSSLRRAHQLLASQRAAIESAAEARGWTVEEEIADRLRLAERASRAASHDWVPKELVEKVEALAAEHGRPMRDEMVSLLEAGLHAGRLTAGQRALIRVLLTVASAPINQLASKEAGDQGALTFWRDFISDIGSDDQLVEADMHLRKLAEFTASRISEQLLAPVDQATLVNALVSAVKVDMRAPGAVTPELDALLKPEARPRQESATVQGGGDIDRLILKARKAVKAGVRDTALDSIQHQIATVLSSSAGATQDQRRELSSLLTTLQALPTREALEPSSKARLALPPEISPGEAEQRARDFAARAATDVQGLILKAESAIEHGIRDAIAEDAMWRLDAVLTYGNLAGKVKAKLQQLLNTLLALPAKDVGSSNDTLAKAERRRR
jgi:hypothetical protein